MMAGMNLFGQLMVSGLPLIKMSTMGFPVGTPLMVLDRVSYSADGKPREHTLYYAQASSYEFSIKVRGPMDLVAKLKHSA